MNSQKQQQQQQKNKTLLMGYIGVSLVPKTGDKMYALITIKCIITFHLFSLLCLRRLSC